ncbi:MULTISPECIES: ABC transporter substrate-binding protein [unclassified Arthrobacter]|uniref:ABC transporter substrate-binding protein n=1 Tax=unclassified Arthrobacter TaxID=235627 RepID=UPI000CE53FAD|nr:MULTISPECIES: ABC transporter substrate-binding protein [unclassified Arthrobacter]
MSRSARTRFLAAATALAVGLAGCGTEVSDGAPATGGNYPVTVENCGMEVVFEQRPERGVLLRSAAVPYLHELGVLDDFITARAGAYPRGYYDDETWAELERIPMLSDELDTSGHLQISKEAVLAQEPQIVLGGAVNLGRDALEAAGVPLMEEPGLCPVPPANPSFDDIFEQMRTYGRIFDAGAQAKAAVARLEAQLDDVLADVDPGEDRTAAVLYPTVGGGVPYAYGTSSMAHPQLEAAGFTNVFADVDERVFEVTAEELVGRNPDILILLYSDGDPAEVKAALTGVNGAAAMSAVQQDQILVQPFKFTEPSGPLVIDGLARIVERFQFPEQVQW